MSPTRNKQHNLEMIAFLGAIALFCSTLEYLIPKPIPFLRLGLSNLPLMLSFPLLGWKGYIWLLLLKVIGQGFVNGTAFSYIFVLSLVGTTTSGILMRVLWQLLMNRKKPWCTYVGISAAGALISNCSQIGVAQAAFLGDSVWIIAAPMVAVGLVTSVILGFLANLYATSSTWYAQVSAGQDWPSRYDQVLSGHGSYHFDKRSVPVLLGLAMLPAIFFQSSVLLMAIQYIACIILSLAAGRKFRILPALLLTLSMVVVQVIQPMGKVLFSIWSLPITQGALLLGLRKALVLLAMIQISLYMTSGRPDLPGQLGKLMSVQLSYFGQFSQQWKQAMGSNGKNFLLKLDDLFFDACSQAPQESNSQSKIPSTALGISLLVVLYILFAIQFVISSNIT